MLGHLIRQLWRRGSKAFSETKGGGGTTAARQDIETGVALQKNGRLKDAETVYRRILQSQPQNPEAMHLLGHVLNLQRNYAAAADVLKQLVALCPESPDAQLSLGLVRKAQGSLKEAAASF
jgi:Flp pilus assembly protein TadD